ncbi:hypothetical protein ACGFNX_42585 [Streptomyces sp. NPDC048723]|uniref:hypothetical protein n=1 Tax=Streptomyces sp. NPDC048723 TaxID=3365589 RepID=UPI003710BA13
MSGGFARRWTATGAADEELPEPDAETVDDALLARLGDDVHEATRLALAWCTVDEWQPPALAVLCRSADVRRRHASALLPACRELAALERHDLKCLAHALAVLDDEPLVVLHRPTGTGFEVRIGGIGDNFQLHTLLAHVLIGGGHLPGTSPSADSVRLATDPEPARGRTGTVATRAFEFLAPDGERIWNEGLSDDIPVVEGRHLLLLDEPLYRRSWDADRFFPLLPGHGRTDPRPDYGRDAYLVRPHLARPRDPPAVLTRRPGPAPLRRPVPGAGCRVEGGGLDE